MWLYRILCLVLFAVVMIALSTAISKGEWGYGFSWGISIGLIVGCWTGYMDRRDNGPRTPEERIAQYEANRQGFKSFGTFALVLGGLALFGMLSNKYHGY